MENLWEYIRLMAATSNGLYRKTMRHMGRWWLATLMLNIVGLLSEKNPM